MTILVPPYVESYWDAQFWEFLHFGIPFIVVFFIVFAVAKWREYNDE